jgi:hypothetical protein
MVMTVSNQNYAGYGHIAYYWSPDWGDTWIGHPDNPIIAPGQFPQGVPASGFQRTPCLVVDEEFNRYILAYNAGHDTSQKWKRRTYLAIAPRPAASCCITDRGNADGDSQDQVSLGDLTVMIDHLFISFADLDCWEEGNLDESQPEGASSITLGDFTVLIDHLFISLSPLPPCP